MEPTLPMTQELNVAARAKFVTALKEDASGYALIVVAIAAAQIGLFYKPELGAYLVTATLALLMGLAAKYAHVRNVVLAVAIIPLLGMINLSFVQQSAFEQTVVLYSSMLILSLMYRYMLRHRSLPIDSRLSIKGYTTLLPIALGVGAVLGLISYRLLITSYVFGGVSIGLVVAAAILGAIGEESLFRGLIERQAMAIMRPMYAVVMTSLIYLTLSFSHFTLWSLLVGAISTFTLSYVYMKKPNLVLTTALNAASKLVYVWLVAAFLVR